MNKINKWDKRFLDLAQFISLWSKDSSTKVGSVISDSSNRIISVGFNGFAKGVNDTKERYDNREIKLAMIIHSEINSILTANRDLKGCTLYSSFAPCSNCTSIIIQSGIKRVVAPYPSKELQERWGISIELSKALFKEANVKLELYDLLDEFKKEIYSGINLNNQKEMFGTWDVSREDFPEFDSTLF